MRQMIVIKDGDDDDDKDGDDKNKSLISVFVNWFTAACTTTATDCM